MGNFVKRTAFKPRTKPMDATGVLRVASASKTKLATPRVRKCKVCKEPYLPRASFAKTCGVICAVEYVRLENVKRFRKERLEGLAKLKTRSDHMKEAQVAFNYYIRCRAIRFGHVCVSSGATLSMGGIGGGFDAGHYRSVGSAPHLRFNMNNCWGQSKQDNRYGAGASFEYRHGLIMRRDLATVEALEANNDVRKFDIEYLCRIKRIFTKKAKRMMKRAVT